jgi:putative Mn2+ efflux pump MntP
MNMDSLSLIALAFALAMDAFAVALCTGLALPQLTGRHLFRLGFHFGLFQAIMPILGWVAGLTIRDWIVSFDHWVAFGLLSLIGGKMLWEALVLAEEERHSGDPTRGMTMVKLSVATSIDALAVGLTLATLQVSVWLPALVIGLVAGVMTVGGMLLGRRVGCAWGSRVEILGGLMLIGIGLKILLEHLSAGG